MEIVSLILTVVSLGISGWALHKADTARIAVENALGSRNAQDDLARIQRLIASLMEAKDAVMPWITGMPPALRLGRSEVEDLAKLNQAVDNLRTKGPLSVDEPLRRRIVKSANQLDQCFRGIAEGSSNQDHWKAAQSELQLIIPRLEQEERKMKDVQIKSN